MVFECVPLLQHAAGMEQYLEISVRPFPPKKTCNGIVFVGQFLSDKG